jgi:hypothetical protein
MKRHLCLLLLILVFSCEDDSPKPTIYQIDEELLPYLETFLTEANNRGVEFDAENLILEFGTAVDEVCGECSNPGNGGQRKVTIVRSSLCWLDAPSQNREALVFHELGHCLLKRGHRDDKLPNGAVSSIMYSEHNDPYSPCIYDLGGDNSCDKTPRRAYYIDELFDPSTPVPDWGE